MNFVLAVVIFSLVFMILGRPVAPAVIGRIVEGSPVAQAGLKTGDRIAAIDGRPVQYWEDVQRAVQDAQGGMLSLTVQGRGRRAQGRHHADPDEDARSLRRRAPDVGPRGAALRAPVDRRGGRGVPRPEGRDSRAGDVIVSLEGKPVLSWDELAEGHPPAPRPADAARGQAGQPRRSRSPSTQRGQGARTGRQGDRGRAHRHQPRRRGLSPSSAPTRCRRSEKASIARSR